MKLEVGKKYITRDCRIATLKHKINGTFYRYKGDVGDIVDVGWSEGGRFYPQCEDALDILVEYDTVAKLLFF